MKFIKKTKKGFTLVELVVVIAIIAILSGVSVAVYVSVTNKAKQAADSEIISQLNLQMKAQEVLEGKNVTCYDAYLDAKKIGFDLTLMRPSYGDHYVWDEEHDTFAVTKNDEVIAQSKDASLTTNKQKQWIFNSVISPTEQRSQFASALSYDEPIKVCSGFDAGVSEINTSVSYENVSGNARTVILRTNSVATTLNVNGPLDTVKHYDAVGAVVVEAVADHSYIEYGNGGIVQMKDGHIVVTAQSDIAKIHISKKEVEEGKPDEFEDIKITIEDDADLPQLSRDPVEIPAEGIKVCTVETKETTEEVVLFKEGITEQIKLVEVEEEVETGETRWADPAVEDTQNEAAVMLSNNLNGFNRGEDGKIETSTITDKDDQGEVVSTVEISFDYETREFTTTQTEGKTLTQDELKEKVDERITETGKDAEQVVEETIQSYFADVWDGKIDTTWYSESENEFIILTAEQLAGFAKLVNDGKTFDGKTVKLGRDLNLNENPDFEEFENMNTWTAIGYAYGSYLPLKPFCGSFDGQGHTISNMFRRCYNTSEYFSDTYGAIYPYGLFGCVKNATIKNLVVDSAYFAGEEDVWYTNAMGGFVGVAFGDCLFDSLTLKNSYLCGYISNCGGIVGGCTSGNMTFSHINVDNTNVLTTWDWGKWSSCDCQMGGIIGQIDIQDNYPDAEHTNANGLYTTHVSMSNCVVACQLMQMNDVMSNYAWYQYRSSGMLIGGFTHNKSDGLWNNCDNVTDKMLEEALTCEDVRVIYDMWNHQYYCCSEEHDPSRTYAGDHAGRFNKDDNFVDGVEHGSHADGCCGEHDCLVFNQLIGGWSGGTWRYETGDSYVAYTGVVVTYLNGSQPTE